MVLNIPLLDHVIILHGLDRDPMPKGQTKRHRTGAKRPQSVFALQPIKTQKKVKTINTIKEEEKEADKYKKLTDYAIRQKKLDIEEAEARALAAIRERRRAEKEIASYLPPLSKSLARSITKPKQSKNNIDAALEKEEAEEAEKELKREERKLRVAEEKRLFERTQKAKKGRKQRIANEKKYSLEHLSFEDVRKERYEELIAQGIDSEKADRAARDYANIRIDPVFRAMNEGKRTWANILNEADEEEAKKPKKRINAAFIKAYQPLDPNASLVAVPTYTRKAAKDDKKLVISGLPTETDRGSLDLRKMKRSIYGTMTGKEIFGPTRPKELDEVIIIPKLAGAFDLMKVGAEVYKVSGTGNKLSATITYPTKALAEQALAYAKTHTIRIKNVVVDVRAS